MEQRQSTFDRSRSDFPRGVLCPLFCLLLIALSPVFNAGASKSRSALSFAVTAVPASASRWLSPVCGPMDRVPPRPD